MSNNQAGKGSKPRPINKKTFNDNYDKIIWNKAKDSANPPVFKKGKTIYKY